jgi:hypothetical protein
MDRHQAKQVGIPQQQHHFLHRMIDGWGRTRKTDPMDRVSNIAAVRDGQNDGPVSQCRGPEKRKIDS